MYDYILRHTPLSHKGHLQRYILCLFSVCIFSALRDRHSALLLLHYQVFAHFGYNTL